MNLLMNEYGVAPLTGVMSMTKLKNALRKLDDSLVFDLRNARVNGQLQGCTGFVTDPGTGRVVYVSTDRNHGTQTQALYRTAASTSDYRGGHNRFAEYHELPAAVVALLRTGNPR